MDREIVLACLLAFEAGITALAAGWLPASRDGQARASGRYLERLAWRRLWLPLVPAALGGALLFGWALREPSEAEVIPAWVFMVAIPGASLSARMAVRVVRALRQAAGDPPAATVGLWNPRVIVSPRLFAVLDVGALSAVRAHEGAHARHHDPFRSLIARAAADLQWPWPAAAERLRAWRNALELARDEEARASGAEGADLAAAVVAAARLAVATPAAAVGISRQDEFLRERVQRLLLPLPPEPPAPRGFGALFLTALTAAVFLGAQLGEAVLGAVLVSAR